MSKRQLTYIANVRMPTEKAHGIQIAKMCEAFTKIGYTVTLVYPQRLQINKDLRNQHIFEYYKIKDFFSLKPVWNLDLLPLHQYGINLGPFAYLIQELTFSVSAVIESWRSPLIFTRSKLVAVLFGLLGKRCIYEAHDRSSGSRIEKLIAKQVSIVVCITKSIETSWKKISANTVYAPDGVGEEFFISTNQASARKKLHLPATQKIILYTGNLYNWKGVGTLLSAAEKLNKLHFYLVGGSNIDKNIIPFQQKFNSSKNIHILGHKPYAEIPLWLKAADILVIPNSAKTKKGREDTSPLKLFEYMASGTPIIASKVAAITEILTSNEVTFFNPDSSENLASVIKKQISKPAKTKHINTEKALQYTWLVRAKKIIETI